ncbi:tigger transposable element-derived protein 4-like [Aphis craccivora]|uniref:Tigger transposable element-derived protein 4-like n=1 Tax=Aphis craccivora TaxID=307492 RepID=A0A6G0VYG9_APHCR|nr:tigger transposable element-derived protein 4-like [Aphis craccivora]
MLAVFLNTVEFPVKLSVIDSCSVKIQDINVHVPDTIHAILVGPSGSVKTNIMYNLITYANVLRFENIYLLVYSKTSNQEKYVLLKKIIDDVKGANFFIFTSVDKKNSIIIFDDVICGPQSVIREYFSICRHSGASSVFYLEQTYSKIPTQLVRDNSIFLMILKHDDTNLRHILNHSSADMDFSEFRKMCHFCLNHSDYGFLVIDKIREMNERRYRCGFHTFNRIK